MVALQFPGQAYAQVADNYRLFLFHALNFMMPAVMLREFLTKLTGWHLIVRLIVNVPVGFGVPAYITSVLRSTNTGAPRRTTDVHVAPTINLLPCSAQPTFSLFHTHITYIVMGETHSSTTIARCSTQISSQHVPRSYTTSTSSTLSSASVPARCSA